jgi:maltose phosphorylase
MVTIDGTESCGVWQHGNLEIHVTAAVQYAVYHYVTNTGDKQLLRDYGAELLLASAVYFESRGGYSPLTGEFGWYGVMGPDEFHMMVHNNTYTNYMVKKMFEYTADVFDELKKTDKKKYDELLKKHDPDGKVLSNLRGLASKIRINLAKNGAREGIYEQHDGYFDIPEIDVNTIPPDRVPIYKFWAYDSIFRVNMLKQPDVVLMQFLFSNDFSLESKKKNYEFYEKRCSHESSLSPAIHSIIAAETGFPEQAYKYFGHATRLDLDDYNRNVHQGLHITSMAAAWMNIVYGFAGMRSDGAVLKFNPSLPVAWNKYSFSIQIKGKQLDVEISKTEAVFTLHGSDEEIEIYGKVYKAGKKPLSVALKN